MLKELKFKPFFFRLLTCSCKWLAKTCIYGVMSFAEQYSNQTFSVELELHTNLNRYVQFLEKEKIKKGCYLDGTQLKLRSLDGVEKKKLFQNINLGLLFPDLPDKMKKTEIWEDFIKILYEMKDDRLMIGEIKENTSLWLQKVLSIESFDANKDVTPYLHIFGSHLHEQIYNLKQKGLKWNSFSMQGLEFLNCLDIRCFHRSTNKKLTIIKQLIRKRSRVEILSYNTNIIDIYLDKKDEIIREQKENHARYIMRLNQQQDSGETQKPAEDDDQPDVTAAENEQNF